MTRAAICSAMLLWSLIPRAGEGQTDTVAAPPARLPAVAADAERAPDSITPASALAATDSLGLPHQFRRVYVPENALLDRAKRGQRYVPMNRAEFESRLRQIQSGHPRSDEPSGRITFAHYAASLDSAFQLSGKGTWQIKLSGNTPSLVPLPDLHFALREPRWASEGSSAAGKSAKLGATEDGETALFADRTGSLEFAWSLAGTEDRDHAWSYELSFPPAPGQQLELTLPAGLAPSIEDAMISSTQTNGAAQRRWMIDLAGRSRAKLKISASDGKHAVRPLVLFKPKVTYELSLQGLQLSADCRLDVYDVPLERLEFDLDRSLTLVDVKASDTTLAWSVVGGDENTASKRIAINFPEPVEGTNRLLRIVAVGPLTTGRSWTLPTINARDVIWQDGAMAVVVAAPLSLGRLDLAHCRQTKRETLPLPAAGEAVGLQAFSANAAVTVHVTPRTDRVELTSATIIDLVGNEAMCSYVADVVAQQGKRFQLSADISPDWIIDSVQSSPSGMIADWERQRGEGNATRLVIHLAKTVNRERPLHLIVGATRRRAPLGDTLQAKDLRLLAFDDIVPVRRLALLRTASPYRLDLRRAEDLSRLDPKRLDSTDRSLIGDARQGLLFVIDEAADDVQINLLQEKPRFAAALHTRAIVGDPDVTESYQLQITPESNELDRVIVHFSQARESDLAWTMENGEGVQVSSRRLTLQEQVAAGIGEQGETWDIGLKPAQAEPFTLTSKRTVRGESTMAVALPSLPDATAQEGGVLVELASEFIPELQERRVKALAVESAAAGEYQNILGAYEYDPTEDLLVSKDPALVLKIDRDPAHRRRALIWRRTLDTWFSPSQQAEQRARFWIENSGRSQISITLPNGAALPVVSIDGSRPKAVSFDPETRKLEVPLPVRRRFCLVEANWSRPDASLYGISSRNIEPPTADVPILSRSVTVWLASGYLLADTGSAWQASPVTLPSWRERLFGPLGRPDERDTFEPWLAADWARLARSPDDEDADLPHETALSGPEHQREVWPTAERSDGHTLADRGWVAYPLDGPANDAPVRIVIVRRATVLGLSMGLFLATAGIVYRWRTRRVLHRSVALGILVIAALLLPAAFAPLGAATVIGFLAGQSCRVWLARSPALSVHPIEAAAPSAMTVASLLCLAAVVPPSAHAEEPSGTIPAAAKSAIYDVLIPIDENENVVGDKVYVPEALYRQLFATTRGNPKQERYLITSATYNGDAVSAPAGNRPVSPQRWRATLTVEVLRAPARVLLPFGGKNAQLVPDSGKLNGQPLRFGWDETQQAIAFEIEAAGAAKVELEFRPNPQENSAARGIAFAVPPVPQSSLRLTANDKTPRIVGLGTTTVDPQLKRMLVELGPLDRVSASWSGGASTAEPPPQFDSEELSWLKLRPGSALLNSRITLRVRRGEVKEVRLALDDRLRPLPLSDDSLIESIERLSDGEVRLRFSTPLVERAVLDLAFVVDNVTGAGNFVWPHVELIGAQNSRRYVACTVDPALELAVPLVAGMKSLNSAQFANLWGEAEARPMAFEVVSPAPRWQLEGRPRQAKLASSYRSVAVAEASHISLEWDASIDISGGSRFQLRTQLPADLNIERVEIRDAAGTRPSHWALDDARMLSVFMSAAATGRLELSLRGRLPIDMGGRVAVPLLHVEGSAEENATLLISRRSNVLASVEERASTTGIEAAKALPLPAGVDDAGFAEGSSRQLHPVAAFQVKNGQGPVVLAVHKNQPRIEAIEAVSVSRANDAWQAALDLKIDVAEGVLDVVRIEMPASWSEPLRVDPPMPYELADMAEENRRQLLLFPPEPISGEARFHIEGRLVSGSGQRVRAPDARLVGATALTQYFALPLQQELQSLAWETRGLKPEPIPEGLLRPSGAHTLQTFVRAAEQFQAELRSVEKIADDCQVRLADIAVSWSGDAACYGVATFDIEPAGKKSCRLALPAGFALVNLAVDGRPLRIVPSEDQRWQVPLAGGRLAERIEVVFAGKRPADSAAPSVLEGPRLIGLPVERTLWSVSGPQWAGTVQSSDIDAVDEARFELARYASIAGVLESAANTLSELPPDERQHFYIPWAARLRGARDAFDHWRLAGQGSEVDLESMAMVSRIDQAQQRLAEQLETEEILRRMRAEGSPDESAIGIWNASLGRSHESLRAVAARESPAINVAYSRRYSGDFPARVVQALVAMAFLMVVAAIVLYTSAADWMARRPRLLGVCIGLFWWLFLWPSALGWLIVAAGIFLPQLHRLARRWRPGRTVLLTES